MSDSKLLALLKRIEWREYRNNYDDKCEDCVECGEEKPDHKPDCELKAQIDRLESEAIVLKNRVEYINKIFEINRQRQCKVVTKSDTIPKS